MDVDLHGPDIPRMLGLSGMMSANPNAKKLNPMRYSDNLSAVSIESLMKNKDDAVIWRGPVKHGAIRQFIAEVEWGDLDYLIIDSPPGTGDEPLTITQLIKDASAVIVTTPQEVALADVRKSINFCKTVNMDVVGLIENMSGYTCPHCGEVVDIFGSGGGERTAALARLKLLGKIPFDPNLVKCGDAGVSYQKQYGDAPASRVFGEIASQLDTIFHS
jgi:Mrp family chromosome partitioning ATPase